MKQSCFLGVFFFVAATASFSRADLMLSAVSATAASVFDSTREWGYDFTVGVSDVRLLRLGAYDQGQDGLSGTVRISVWDRSNSSLLVSADISGGTLDSNWRMVSVSPITLLANGVYSFVASTPDTPSFDSIDSFIPVDATSLGTVSTSSLRFENVISGALVFPTQTAGGSSVTFMPGVNADIVAVPEPSSFAAVGLFGCAIWVSAYGRRKLG